jgi:hypothetical protein
LNNGGIGPGMPEIPENPMFNMQPNALIYGARYDSVRTSRLRKREGVGLSRVGCGVGISRGSGETVARSTDTSAHAATGDSSFQRYRFSPSRAFVTNCPLVSVCY